MFRRLHHQAELSEDQSERAPLLTLVGDKVGAPGHSLAPQEAAAGGWKRSSPEAHNAWVKAVDSKLASKVRPLVRFIKAWKFFQNVPISSFYLELYVTSYASSESAIIYTIDIKHVLVRLYNAGLPAIRDPLGVSGTIYPCGTDGQHTDAKSKLYTAATRATKARDAEESGNIKSAFEWWDLLYNAEDS